MIRIKSLLKYKQVNLKKIFPYLIAVLLFILVSLIYFSPVLKGEKIFQRDIEQFRGMSKEIVDFRKDHNNQEPYWTTAAFGGMPSYQLSTYYTYDFVKKLDEVIRFLPRPADYLFLYFLGFFVLLSVLKFDWKLSIIGSLAFGFSTYFIIILGVGHNAKAHAIAYMPVVMAGVIWLFQKKYFKGFLLTSVALALEINTSHPQMTYYLLFSLLILGLVYLIETLKEKKSFRDFFKVVVVLMTAALLAIGTNATSLLATKEYADHSTRGKSDLTITVNGKVKETSSGLSKSYITEYSYGLLETFNLFIPRFTGGANTENLGENSYTYNFLKTKIDRGQARQFSKSVPTYWGSQPIVAAPAYIGAVFIFLFVLGIFLLRGPLKKWLIATTVFSILMSWGHNFDILTNFFIDYVPLYNKFRAVSSIQVLAEISIPLLGLLALKAFVYGDQSREVKFKALKSSFFLVGGAALFFVLFGRSLFSFEGLNDAYYNSILKGLGDAIVEDRKSIFYADSIRSFLLVLFSAGGLWLFLKHKLKVSYLFPLFGLLLLFDMVGTARRYVNTANFQAERKIENPFVKSAIDKEILKDRGHYRVANFSLNFMNDGSTSYFHKSIGGYHAAKLGRYQELVNFHLQKNNLQVLNMLHTKYFILPGKNGKRSLQVNPETNGNAWFVEEVAFVKNADEEILALTDFNSKKTAVINRNEFSDFAKKELNFTKDTLATIQLTHYQANEISYVASNKESQLAVFSEIFYKDGWNAYIDGVLTPHIRANYVLRALPVSKGTHEIVFKFEPKIIKKGQTIVLGSLGIFILSLFGRIVYLKKQRK